MTKKFVIALVILALIKCSFQHVDNNEVETEDVNPFAEAASAILKEQSADNIGSMVNGFLENGGVEKIVGSLLSNTGGENGGNLLQGLGSLVGSLAGGGNQGGLNPALLGAVAGLLKNSDLGGNNNKKKKKAKANDDAPGLDLGDMLSLAGSFMGQQGDGGGAGLMQFLPTILSTVNSFVGPEAEKREKSHSDHSWLMPPILEKIHIYFDHFIHSDMGKNLINYLGAEKTFKMFTDDKGKFDYNKFGEMLENHSFRRHWIRLATDRLANIIQIFSDPTVQKQYFSSIPFLVNTFLQGQGFPKKANLDLDRPTESLTAIANYVAKKYFTLKIDSKEYVKPAVKYIKEVFTLSRKQGLLSGGDSRELSDKLADTVNLEIIEPIARVNRAFRFAKQVPKCEKYVFCLVNEENQNEQVSIPGLKKMLSKSSSLIAGWFLTSHTGTSFWDLYNVVTGDERCKEYYLEKCNDFHVEELKVTTEYVHNEL